MKRIVWVSLLSVFVGSVALQAQNIVGDWHGTLKAGGAELRLNLHITKSADGNLSGTLDSIDQPGANGIPLTSVSVQDSVLKLGVDAVKGTYEGKINADASSITGTWTQGQPLPLGFERGAIKQAEHKPAKPSDIDGAWEGTLDMGATKLRIVFHIANTEDGLTATMDSPDQGANGIPVSAATRNGSALKLETKSIAAVFEGKIADDLKTITGTFTQGGGSVPLALVKVK